MKLMQPRYAWVLCMLLLSAPAAWAQTIIVKGKVMEKNDPLPGVNIMVKETKMGAITNDKGEFTISAPANGVLVLSYSGYVTKEIPIQGKTFITTVMESKAAQMEDVIVVGYGTQKKIAATGAIASVKGEDLVKAPVAGVSNALIGMAPGLQAIQMTGEFGADKADIHIRGIATTNKDGRSPLILVDGVVRETFNDIDVNEIETINILKDASATAVFGVRGANGVILITTKTGKTGKPAINFTSNTGMLQPTILPKMLGAYDFALLRNEASKNDGKAPAFTEEDLRLYKTGEDPIFHSNTDWLNELIKPFSFQQQHNMNISGGTDKLRYFTSLGYFNQGGGYRQPQQSFGFPYKHNYDRYNIRMNFDFNFTEDFSMSVKLGEQITDNVYPNGGAWAAFDKAINTPPVAGPAFIDGKYIESIKGLPSGVQFFNPWGQAGRTSAGGAFVTDVFANTLNTNVGLKYKLDKLVPGLAIRAMGAYDSYYKKEDVRSKMFAAYTVLKDANAPGGYILYKSKDDGPWYGLTDDIPDRNKWRKYYAEAALEYNRTFANTHHVTGLILGNMSKEVNPNLVPKLPTAYLGLVSRVTYDYRSRYFAEVDMGYNGSENFPEDKRYGFFPATSLGWLVTEEPFFPKNNILTFLKVRGSYGEVGNDKIGGYRYMYLDPPYTLGNGNYQAAVFGTSGLDMARYNMYIEGNLGNHGVTWEVAKKWNVGADMQFFNNKLNITGDYYQEKRKNILQIINAPELVAANLPPANIGQVENHGYELEVGYKDRIDRLNYWLKATYSFARNKIIYNQEAPPPYDYMRRTGQPIDQYYGLQFEGFYNTIEELTDPKRPQSYWAPNTLQLGDMKYKDMNDDGIIDANDAGPIGYTNWPEITYSFSFGGEYKGFDLTALIQGVDHVSVYFASQAAFPFTADWGPAFEWNLERWTQERYNNGEKITYPRLELSAGSSHNSQVSSFWVQNGAYIRLKNLQLGYRFSNGLLSRAGLKSLRLYVSGNNLITLTDIKYRVDPDAREQWGRVYPAMRVFNAGINLNF